MTRNIFLCLVIIFHQINAFTCQDLSKKGRYKLGKIGTLVLTKDFKYELTTILKTPPEVMAVSYFNDKPYINKSHLFYKKIKLLPSYCAKSSNKNILTSKNGEDIYDFTFYDYNLKTHKFTIRLSNINKF